MNAVNFRLRSRVLAVAPLVLAGLVLPAFAGEPAKISAPGGPADPSNLAKPAEPFQPLERGSSVSGVVDGAAAAPALPAATPDARTQKAMFERLDRQKNWLLDDQPGSKRNENSFLPEAGSDQDYSSNPGQPQTVLQRRLKNGGRTDTTKAAGDAAEREARKTSDSDPDLLAPSKLETFAPTLPAFGSAPAWERASSGSRSDLLFGAASQPASLDDLRSDRSSSSLRNSAFDAPGRDRLERFQQNFGEGDLARKGPATDAASSLNRTRESRSDTMNSLLVAAPQTGLSTLGGAPVNPAEAAALARPASLDSSRLGGGFSPYTPLTPTATPTPTPAAQFLKTGPAQPPKFRQ